MSPDEARDLFSEALEGELDLPTQAAFDEVLATDDELREEYAAFAEMLRGAADLGIDEEVDLLGGVQSRLRTRSKGRFYRDRFATEDGGPSLGAAWIGLIGLSLLLLLIWLGAHGILLGEG